MSTELGDECCASPAELTHLRGAGFVSLGSFVAPVGAKRRRVGGRGGGGAGGGAPLAAPLAELELAVRRALAALGRLRGSERAGMVSGLRACQSELQRGCGATGLAVDDPMERR